MGSWQRARSRSFKSRRRRAAVTMELLIGMPVILIGLFAVIQFSLYFSNAQQLALASRVGAEAGSQIELPNRTSYGVPPTAPGNRIPDQLATAILQQLQTANISPCCIILEHNVNRIETPGGSKYPRQVFFREFAPCRCELPQEPLPPKSVRVTICVRLTELMPNSLAALGFDISSKSQLLCRTGRL